VVSCFNYNTLPTTRQASAWRFTHLRLQPQPSFRASDPVRPWA